MSKGEIVHWIENRSYGFVKVDGCGNHDVFLHANHITAGTPFVGATVEFDIFENKDRPSGSKKLMATNARILA